MYYKKPAMWSPVFGEIYICNHPLYNRCTLFRKEELGIAIIQQRFDSRKRTYWDAIDPWLANDIYRSKWFPAFFEKHARSPENDLYPTISVRSAMRQVGLPPLEKQFWETRF